jgi:hypothetical protein
MTKNGAQNNSGSSGNSYRSQLITTLISILVSVLGTLLTVSFATSNKLSAAEQRIGSLENNENLIRTDMGANKDRVQNLSVQVAVLTERLAHVEGSPTSHQVSVSPKVAESVETMTPRLVSFIKAIQKENVRESYGTYHGECFSDEDYDAFVAGNRAEQIAVKAATTEEFKTIAACLAGLSNADREKVFATASDTARPTWAQQGKINSDGQTEAGQKAERLIAGAIVKHLRNAVK